MNPLAGPSGAPLFNPNAWMGALGVAAVGWLWGWILLPGRRAGRGMDLLCLRLAIGLIATSVMTLLVGQGQGWLFHVPWRGVALGGALWAGGVTAHERRGRNRDLEAHGQASGLEPTAAEHSPSAKTCETWVASAPQVIGWSLAAIWLAGLLGTAFCPPRAYDVLEYHLGIVPHIFELGRIRPIPHVFYTAQPLGTEMLYLLASVIEGDPWGYAPGAVQWLLILLGAGLFVGVLRALRIPPAWRPWLLLVLLSHPILLGQQVDRLTDWTGVVMLAAGVLFHLQHPRDPTGEDDRRPLRRRSAPLVLGILAGGAVGAKWTNLGTVAVALLFLVALDAMRPALATGASAGRQLRAGFRSVLVFGASALAAWLPWGAWLWIVCGNPFAPFLAGLFPTPDWPPACLRFLTATHGPLSWWRSDFWTNLVARLTWRLPGAPLIALGLVGYGAVALLQRARGRQGGGPGQAPKARPTPAGAFALSLIVSALLWGRLRHAADRFLAPSMMLGLILTALALQWLIGGSDEDAGEAKARRSVWGIAILLAALAIPCLASPLGDFYGRELWRHALGRTTRLDFWRSRSAMGMTTELFVAADRLPRDARILAVHEARSYPFSRPVTLATVFDVNPLRAIVRGAADADEIRARLVRRGFTHLLVNEFEQARLLQVHPPPGLIGDPQYVALRSDPRALVEAYRGWSEFAVDPLTPAERRVYAQFLLDARRRAVWLRSNDPAQVPALWIAPLVEPSPGGGP